MAAKGIRDKLPELRKARGWSRERLSHSAFRIDEEGTSAAQITAIERGDRRASARTIAALAKALDVAPTEFLEYRLALARHVLDEDKVGLAQAIKTLEKTGLEPIDVPISEIKKHSHHRRRAVKRGRGKA
jgi:transcriptional regulator with XRE-family HTH domain